ncbi:extracellular solute-binding protein [Actinocorallia libanotica]|uniref:ABC transporter substrate-binding protein n=1 Tax=Actinocorallia libanotica TaxID=46162 RepID=A0ABN1RE13_9ACTN
MKRLRAVLAVCTALCTGLVLSACSTEEKAEGRAEPLRSAGAAEGSLQLLTLPGYAEEGFEDRGVDWVTPFEESTGCQVTVRTAGTAQEIHDRMAGGFYDGALVPSEAFGRLVDGGRLAPVNTRLLDSYKSLDVRLRRLVEREDTSYGMPATWGADLLLFETGKAQPASWGAVFDPRESKPYHKRIVWRDSPHTIASAALYLKHRKRSLKIRDPYELSAEQLEAVTELLQEQRPNVLRVTEDPTQAVEAFSVGDAVVGMGGTYELDVLARGGRPIAVASPKEGVTGWYTAWAISSRARNPNCMYRWMNWVSTPEVQKQTAEWRGVAPADGRACGLLRAGFCAAHHVGDRAYIDRLVFARTPDADCEKEPECAGWSDWTRAWSSLG